MFLCVSPNPAIDRRLTLPSLSRGQVNRVRGVQSFPGGKSVHVAMVLRTLGGKPHWIGPCGGASGQELITGLAAMGIAATACSTHQPTRTNLEIVEDEGVVTELLEPGSVACPAEWAEFETAVRSLCSQAERNTSAIFSGSLPAGAEPDLHARLVTIARECGRRTLLDTSGEPLRLALAARPDLVKPNRDEVTELLGMPVDSPADAERAIRKLVGLGARSVALSMGATGLFFCPASDAPVLFAPGVSVQPRSTVGCGDSAMAGFALGLEANDAPQDTLRLAAACAAANCLADSPGGARLTDIQEFRRRISVETLASSP
jgi:1-phosphofructokinase family hexose kinase